MTSITLQTAQCGSITETETMQTKKKQTKKNITCLTLVWCVLKIKMAQIQQKKMSSGCLT